MTCQFSVCRQKREAKQVRQLVLITWNEWCVCIQTRLLLLSWFSCMIYDVQHQIPSWQTTEPCLQPLTQQRRLSWFGLVVSNCANLSQAALVSVEKYIREVVYLVPLSEPNPFFFFFFQVRRHGVRTNLTIIWLQRSQREPELLCFSVQLCSWHVCVEILWWTQPRGILISLLLL